MISVFGHENFAVFFPFLKWYFIKDINGSSFSKPFGQNFFILILFYPMPIRFIAILFLEENQNLRWIPLVCPVQVLGDICGRFPDDGFWSFLLVSAVALHSRPPRTLSPQISLRSLWTPTTPYYQAPPRTSPPRGHSDSKSNVRWVWRSRWRSCWIGSRPPWVHWTCCRRTTDTWHIPLK